MPVEQIEQRLDQRFRLLTGGSRTALPRHQTLRSLIDWSYDLLSEKEKALLRRLSVFSGGWTLEAAEQVCGDSTGNGFQALRYSGVQEPDGGVDPPECLTTRIPEHLGIEPWEILDLLTSLSDKSLVIYQESAGVARYRLLETVRQYARDRLLESGEGETWRDRHLAHFLALAEEAQSQLTGKEQARWLERLDIEHDNLRAALAWSFEGNGEEESGLRLCCALGRFWLIRGYFAEGRFRCGMSLESAGGGDRTQLRAKTLNAAGILARNQADYPAARSLLEESLSIFRELGNRHGIAISLLSLGNATYHQGNYPAARTLYEESLSIARELGDLHRIASALGNLANVASNQGDYPAARSLHEESISIFRELGDRKGVASALANLANAAGRQGEFAAARSLHEESISIFRELGDRQGAANSLHGLANVAGYQGDYPAARSLHKESLSIFRELGDREGIADSLNNLGIVASCQGKFGSARILCEESLTIRRELGDSSGMASSLEGIAQIAATVAGSVTGARLWGAAERLREEIGAPLPLGKRQDYDKQVAAARAAIGDDAAFDAAWQEGRAMTLDEALQMALTGAQP
jgi:non-specific serine/threonine protein kinase